MTTTVVSSGQTSSNVVLKYGDYELVETGGTAVNTVVSSGGFEDTQSGGLISGATVFSGGEIDPRSGARAVGIVLSGGREDVEGTASGTIVGSGSFETIFNGASTVSSTILRGGLQDVNGGAVASGTTVSAGALEYVYSGGTAKGTNVLSGGAVVVLPGATVSTSGPGLVVSTGVVYASDGQITSATAVSGVSFSAGTYDPIAVLQGGTATSVTLMTFAQLDVYSGGSTTGTVVSSGGFESLGSGGTESGTVVLSGAGSYNGGGTESGTVVSNGGVINTYGGTEFNTTVSSGGTQAVEGAGVASGTLILTGVSAQIASGGVTVATTVSSGGTFVLLSGSVGSGTTVSFGGLAFVSSAGTAISTTVASGGTESVLSGGIASATFVANGGTETVVSGGNATSTTFAGGGKLDLPFLPFTRSGAAYINNSGLLSVTEGMATPYTQQLANYAGETVTLSQDAAGGTLVTIVCFATGTRVGTARGAIAVEELVVGDIAATASGRLRPVTWIGHRHLAGDGSALPHDQQPIRIRQGAFGRDALGSELPRRDLLLSPGHPVLVGADGDNEGGHLVPVMCLVNGTTVERMAVERVTYWHVELDAHDILLAEGLPAESYLDWGDRAFFTQADHRTLANPDFVVPGLAGRCRPVAVDGPVVEAERRRLDAVFATALAAQCIWDGQESSPCPQAGAVGQPFASGF